MTSPSGKCYIGKTIQALEARKAAHIRRAKEIKYRSKFAAAIKKYGSLLVWEVLYANVPESIIDQVEMWTISCHQSVMLGYNSTDGGTGGDTYSQISPERLGLIRSKISKSLKKTFLNPAHREALSKRSKGKNNPMYGKTGAMKDKHHTTEAKSKMAAAKIGDLNPSKRPEVRKKISRTRKVNKILAEREFPQMIEKPWGYEFIMAYNKSYCYKRIGINAGHATSLQYHEQKTETNYILSGEALFYYADKLGNIESTKVGPGFFVQLSPGDIHRFEALTNLVLLEASSPEIWDVIRLEDSYGREDSFDYPKAANNE